MRRIVRLSAMLVYQLLIRIQTLTLPTLLVMMEASLSSVGSQYTKGLLHLCEYKLSKALYPTYLSTNGSVPVIEEANPGPLTRTPQRCSIAYLTETV